MTYPMIYAVTGSLRLWLCSSSPDMSEPGTI
jgi:hypothetical protein